MKQFFFSYSHSCGNGNCVIKTPHEPRSIEEIRKLQGKIEEYSGHSKGQVIILWWKELESE